MPKNRTFGHDVFLFLWENSLAILVVASKNYAILKPIEEKHLGCY